jgi:hypothetical protein
MDRFQLIEPESEKEKGDKSGHTKELTDAQFDSLFAEPVDERAPIPFGASGAQFLCNLMHHGIFLGIAMLILMIISYFGAR